jgi:FtsP/CotA-like multicopper oxidase with cupredoxin domain
LEIGIITPSSLAETHTDAAPALEPLQPNSNQVPAGSISKGTLSIEMEVREGEWFPEDEHGPSVKIYALAERGKPAVVPGPLIRVPQGTTIHVQIRNRIPVQVVMHGMHARPGNIDDVLLIPPGEAREVTFPAGDPGA